MIVLTTLLPYAAMLCGVGLLWGAAWQMDLPVSRYNAKYADIGTRDDLQLFMWVVFGLGLLAIGADYAFTGGMFTHSVFARLR